MSDYATVRKDAHVFRSVFTWLGAQSVQPGHLGHVVLEGPDPEDFPHLVRWVLRTGNLTLVIDEAYQVATGEGLRALVHLMRVGRHSGVDLYVVARRPVELPRDVTAMANELRFFRTTEARDLEWIRQACSQETASEVRRLPPFHSISFRI